jgi:cytosine/uracil/thiamine/allantoin permease
LNGAALAPALGVMLLSHWLNKKPAPRVAVLAWLLGAATAIGGQVLGQSVAILLGAGVSLLVVVVDAILKLDDSPLARRLR